MRKKVGMLLALAMVVTTVVTGCGESEPEDHIWAAKKSIKKQDVSYESMVYQFDGIIVDTSELSTMGDYIKLFPKDDYYYYFEGNKSETYTAEETWSGYHVEAHRNGAVVVCNRYFPNDNEIFTLHVTNNTESDQNVLDCDAYISKINDEYVGATYFAGGFPLSEGAFDKYGYEYNYEELKKIIEKKDFEFEDSYVPSETNLPLVCIDKDGYSLYIVSQPDEDGDTEEHLIRYRFDGEGDSLIKSFDVELNY